MRQAGRRLEDLGLGENTDLDLDLHIVVVLLVFCVGGVPSGGLYLSYVMLDGFTQRFIYVFLLNSRK